MKKGRVLLKECRMRDVGQAAQDFKGSFLQLTRRLFEVHIW